MDNLKELFSDPRITITGFAEKMGKSRSWLSQRIHGHEKFKPDELKELQRHINELGGELKNFKIKNNE